VNNLDEYTTCDKFFYRMCPECGYPNERPDDEDEGMKIIK
jgi:hypothetical protein